MRPRGSARAGSATAGPSEPAGAGPVATVTAAAAGGVEALEPGAASRSLEGRERAYLPAHDVRSLGAGGREEGASDPPVPLVSVLITAFRRREFLRSAVDSVLASTLARDLYEIVVVKDFADPELDPYLAAHGIVVVPSGEGPIGSSIELGLRASHGGIVCLLNDDDEFEPGKLARVVELFGSVPDLLYVHDRRVLVDADGRPLPVRARWEKPQLGPIVLVDEIDRRTKVGLVHRNRGLFHDSCISVARRVYDGHLEALPQVEVSEDVFTFYCALARPGRLFLDDQRLTRFRVHGKSKYRMEKSRGQAEEVRRRRRTFLALIDDVTRGTPAETAAKVFTTVTRHQEFLEGDPGVRPSFGAYWDLFVAVLRFRVPSHAVLFGLSVVKIVAPGMTHRFFGRFWATLDDAVT